ncbi:MAG TPA: SGNH/GDSL hydrolase family protein [Thermoanaerobaculia bacterium]|nr:SGNH/GDSL hydrolase family protein [Thermoanaerobaculia bacterium]
MMSDDAGRPRAGAKWAVLLVTCVVAVLIAEGMLRLFWTNPYGSNSVRMMVELQTQTKGVSRQIDRTVINKKNPIISFRTDGRGYIEPVRRFDRPDATVAFFGGSTTECMFVAEPMRFPARASVLLEQRRMKINALNAGVSGNDVHQSINNLFNYVVADKPDVAVLMEAANDIGHLRGAGSYQLQMGQAPTLGTLGRLIFTRFSAHSSILALVRHTRTLRDNKRAIDRASGPAAPLGAKRPLPVEQYKQRLRAFVGICRAFSIKPVLMTQPSNAVRNELTPGWYDPEAQIVFNQAIRDVAAEEKVDLIDLVAFLAARPASPEPLFYDGIHVTDYGSDLYAQHIAARLQEIVPPRPTG